MSSAPHQTTIAADAPDWSMLVPVSEAARMLGLNQGHLRRQCGTSLAAAGMAVYAKPPGGGNSRWYVSRRYDLKLAPGVAGIRQRAPDLSSFSQKQQTTAWQRAACVEAFNKERCLWPGNQCDWLPRLIDDLRSKHGGLTISQRSLFRWRELYRNPADIVELVDDRGGNTRGKGDPTAWTAFRDMYLDDRQPSLRSCWSRVKQMARANDLEWCSYKGCQRQLNHRIPPESQLRHRNHKRWRTQMQPTIAQDTEAWAAGQCWVGDHKQMDLWCRVGKRLIRPWLTAWLDWRTRRIAGWSLSESPNSSTILAALRHGLTDERNMGGPSVGWIDNGKDYDCWAFHGQTKQQRLSKQKIEAHEAPTHGLFGLLGIEVHFSLAYNPNGKARMERWFRSIEDFAKSFASYAGRSTDTRPESLRKILDNRRLVPSFDHVKDRLAEYIKGNNARTDHAIEDLSEDGVAISPDQAMARWCHTRRVMADPSVLDLLLQAWHKPVTATRNGITVNIAGKRLAYGQFDPALSPFKALAVKDRPKLLVSYDPHDIKQIRVYDLSYRFICEASLNGVGGLHGQDAASRDHVSELIRQKNQYRKSLNFLKEHREHEYLTDAELLADMIQSEAPQPPDPNDPAQAMKVIQTPLDGQSKAVQAEQFRKAAGAEHDELPIEFETGPLGGGVQQDLDDGPLEFESPSKDGGHDDTDDEPLEFESPSKDGGHDDTDDEPLELEVSASVADRNDIDMDVDLELIRTVQDDGDDYLLDNLR